jgi:hypothetical protein
VSLDLLGLRGALLLERYRVESVVARGGMSIAYRGDDLRLHRPVCIKVFHQLDGSAFEVRAAHEHFVKEAFALSQLSHPHTLRIYDFGYLDSLCRTPFQVSELLDGGTLFHLVRREGPSTPAAMYSLIEPLTGALDEAHRRGIIHCDIKPSNIFLATLGASRIAKLGDFGIAKTPADLPGDVTERGESAEGLKLCVYSRAWAAPEQLCGEPPMAATDVFSLGLVTAFLLCGRCVLSPGDEVENFRARLDLDGHVARTVQEMNLSAELRSVLLTACRAEPAERYESVTQFASALARAVQSARPSRNVGESPAATPPERAHQVVDCREAREVTVLGRRLRLLDLRGADHLELGGDAGALPSTARVRMTLMPSSTGLPRLNVKGLNCFVARDESRLAIAVDVERDLHLELVAPDRRRLDGVRCILGQLVGRRCIYDVGGLSLTVTGAQGGAIVLDLGPGRELLLVHGGATAARARGTL